MDWLKQLLGEELFNQVTAKLGDVKIIKDDGNLIPKYRLDEVTTAKEALKTQVDSLTTEIGKLKPLVKDNEAATKNITELQAKLAKAEADGVDLTKRFAVKEALMEAGAKPGYLDMLAQQFDLSKVELDNGKVKGADELIKGHKEKYIDLFGETKRTGAPTVDTGNKDGNVSDSLPPNASIHDSLKYKLTHDETQGGLNA